MQPEDGQRGLRAPAVAALGALALLAVIVALAALFDLGPFGDDGAGTLTKAEFIAKGDEICKRAHEQFAELQPGPPATPQRAVEQQEQLIQISESEVAQIRNLDRPPTVDAAALRRYLRARERGIALLRKGLEAAKNEDAFAYEAAKQQVAADQLHRLKLAQAVGFSVCSRPVPQG
jgi:hypothetical protein